MKKCALILCVIGMLGCGPSAPSYNLAPFSGVVKLDGKPLARANVMFTPQNNTKSPGGYGVTDESGKYEIMLAANAAGGAPKKGIPAGDYYVTFSKFVKPDGSEIPADNKEPPINLGATESIPMKYTPANDVKLEAKVPEKGGTQDYDLTSQ